MWALAFLVKTAAALLPASAHFKAQRFSRTMQISCCAQPEPGRQQDHVLVTDRELIEQATRRPYALLFNPRTDNEGIYSLQLPEEECADEDASREIVVCFEVLDDAQRYADMLLAQDFPEARPVEIDLHQLFEFCDEGGHILGLARQGSLIIPPIANAAEWAWNPGESAEALEPSSAETQKQRAALEAIFSKNDEL